MFKQIRILSSPPAFCASCYGLLAALISVMHFPYHTDPPHTRPSVPTVKQNSQAFYERVYETGEESAKEQKYVQIARKMADAMGVKDSIRHFITRHGLERKKILDVGAGSGYLQDLVGDYTGLDISSTARKYFHKPFVQASATDMPFEDGTFDAVWTVWVLEHVPHPEHALYEIRRVLKNGGLLYLDPAWMCPAWAADGYEIRPYSDFGISGKIQKASLSIRSSLVFQALGLYPSRALRLAVSKLGSTPTRYRYGLLEPNYEEYWVPDSDALNSLDRYETILWFRSRGDECLNCRGGRYDFLNTHGALIIRVRKPGLAQTAAFRQQAHDQ